MGSHHDRHKAGGGASGGLGGDGGGGDGGSGGGDGGNLYVGTRIVVDFRPLPPLPTYSFLGSTPRVLVLCLVSLDVLSN